MTPQEQPVKRTRAQVFRDRVVIRLATNEAGVEIAKILEENKVKVAADWSACFPHWLIACDGDDVIGCVMVLPAKPFGFVEFLLVKPSASFKLRAIAIRKLCLQALATLKVYGSSAATCTVDESNKKFGDILTTKMGFVSATKGDLMVKRL